MHDRQPLHDHRGRRVGRGRGARRRRRSSTASIPVIDAETGEELSRGVVPPWCVGRAGHAGRRTFPGGEFGLPCVLVIKRLTEGERHDKAQLNDILRDHGVDRLTGDRPPGPHRRAGRHPVGQPRRGGHRRPRSRPRLRAVPVARRSTGSATTSWPAPTLGRAARLVLAGHTDTVPANGNERARVEGDALWGLGACRHEGGLAVLLELARTVAEPGRRRHLRLLRGRGGRGRAQRARASCSPSAPTCSPATPPSSASRPAARIEAGCQGTMRARGHACRGSGPTPPGRGWAATPSTGSARLLGRLDAYEGRRPVLDGCEYREALQAVRVEGGVAGNVVPDRATVDAQPPLRPRPRRPTRPRPTCGTLLGAVPRGRRRRRAGRRAPPARRRRSTTRCCAALVERNGLAGAGQARLDRRRPLRRPRHPGRQLRPGRPDAGPHAPTSGSSGPPSSRLLRRPARRATCSGA